MGVTEGYQFGLGLLIPRLSMYINKNRENNEDDGKNDTVEEPETEKGCSGVGSD